ncbi:MAG: hypothetical protein J5I90_06465 [Caldilineales bacterium]|nr:hypothetical protein [Caldilineales bacterium]
MIYRRTTQRITNKEARRKLELMQARAQLEDYEAAVRDGTLDPRSNAAKLWRLSLRQRIDRIDGKPTVRPIERLTMSSTCEVVKR